jgi:RNA polymerase-binding transcription factor DksA
MELRMAGLSEKDLKAVGRELDRFEQAVRAAMRSALAEARSDVGGIAADVHDLGEESVADELRAVNSALAERHGYELGLVEDARARLDSREIGQCADCEGEIGLQRLLANPVARRCIACESQRERTHAHSATPRL